MRSIFFIHLLVCCVSAKAQILGLPPTVTLKAASWEAAADGDRAPRPQIIFAHGTFNSDRLFHLFITCHKGTCWPKTPTTNVSKSRTFFTIYDCSGTKRKVAATSNIAATDGRQGFYIFMPDDTIPSTVAEAETAHVPKVFNLQFVGADGACYTVPFNIVVPRH
jgi:hypothetical protein